MMRGTARMLVLRNDWNSSDVQRGNLQWHIK